MSEPPRIPQNLVYRRSHCRPRSSEHSTAMDTHPTPCWRESGGAELLQSLASKRALSRSLRSSRRQSREIRIRGAGSRCFRNPFLADALRFSIHRREIDQRRFSLEPRKWPIFWKGDCGIEFAQKLGDDKGPFASGRQTGLPARGPLPESAAASVACSRGRVHHR